MDIYFDALSDTIQGFKDGECQDTNGSGETCGFVIGTSSNSGSYLFFDPIFTYGFEF